MSKVIDDLRNSIPSASVTFQSYGEDGINILYNDRILFIPMGVLTDSSDLGDATEEEVRPFCFWLDENGDMQCGEKFVASATEFAAARVKNDFNGTWDAWLESVLVDII